MATRRRFYPNSRDARRSWHDNWAGKLPSIAVKYGISAAVLAEVAADNAWMQYWCQFRTNADAQSQALTRYFNTVAGDDPNEAQPAAVSWSLSAGVPAEVPPGIENRVYEIADQILGDMDYSSADGELVGIVASDTPTSPTQPGDPVSPVYTLVTLAEFALQATFQKLGHNAVKFQFRHKGGNWIDAGVLLNSPGSFTVAPQTPGTAEQIEVRAIYLLGNLEVGVYSDAKPAFIAM